MGALWQIGRFIGVSNVRRCLTHKWTTCRGVQKRKRLIFQWPLNLLTLSNGIRLNLLWRIGSTHMTSGNKVEHRKETQMTFSPGIRPLSSCRDLTCDEKNECEEEISAEFCSVYWHWRRMKGFSSLRTVRLGSTLFSFFSYFPNHLSTSSTVFNMSEKKKTTLLSWVPVQQNHIPAVTEPDSSSHYGISEYRVVTLLWVAISSEARLTVK